MPQKICQLILILILGYMIRSETVPEPILHPSDPGFCAHDFPRISEPIFGPLPNAPGLFGVRREPFDVGQRLRSLEHDLRGTEFIAAVRPAAAVVSVGYLNRFHFPAAEVIDRYTAAGVTVLRTDQDGLITVRTDGRRVSVETFRLP